ncbi:hypothetical protein V6R86_11800 [Sphingomonas kaistensis]|uniref:Uncharacterized protein n=1 Tax=Sphingomonas kaistensis TaxID=298708 RepID=A0ABZ2G5E4_9SPHN
MEDLEHVLIVDQQIPQRLQVDTLGHRIDRGGFVDRGDLDQAEFGPVGAFAHEFSVHGHEVVGG